MKKYIINMLVTIMFATASQAQVPVITSHPQSVTVCLGSTATFNVAASNNPTGYKWEYSINDGETWDVASGVQSFQAFQVTILPPNIHRIILVRSTANNANGSSEPSAAAILKVLRASDSLYIVKPNTTPTCMGNSFLLAGSQANGVFSSTNSNVATVNCSGLVNVKTQGNCSIKYIYTSTNGCSDTATYSLNTNNPSAATINGSNSLCVGANTTFTTNINNGVWSSNDRLSIDSRTGLATGSNAGATKVNYTITGNNGCKTKTEFATTVNAVPPVPSIIYAPGTSNPQNGAPRGSFCVGKIFGVVGTPNLPAGSWSSTGAASITTNGIVTINSLGAGSIKYTYTDNNGCSNSRTMIGNGFACAARGVSINSELTAINNDLVIYPNPAHSFISFNVDNIVGSGNMIVTDLYGKQLKNQSLSLGINTINIAELAKGIYFVNIVINNTRQVKKVIVE